MHFMYTLHTTHYTLVKTFCKLKKMMMIEGGRRDERKSCLFIWDFSLTLTLTPLEHGTRNEMTINESRMTVSSLFTRNALNKQKCVLSVFVESC